MLRTTFFWVSIILMLAFAAVQFNDPDGWLWIGVYLLAAVLSLRAWQRFGSPNWYYVAAVLYALWAANQFPPVWEGVGENEMGMKTLNIELARESLGLLICALICLKAGYWVRRP